MVILIGLKYFHDSLNIILILAGGSEFSYQEVVNFSELNVSKFFQHLRNEIK